MSKTVIVRYRTRPYSADENARLIKAVLSAVTAVGPADFQYAIYRLADGVTFVHVARHGGDENPLVDLPEFVEFTRELGQRCAEPPAPSEATLVGSYGHE